MEIDINSEEGKQAISTAVAKVFHLQSSEVRHILDKLPFDELVAKHNGNPGQLIDDINSRLSTHIIEKMSKLKVLNMWLRSPFSWQTKLRTVRGLVLANMLFLAFVPLRAYNSLSRHSRTVALPTAIVAVFIVPAFLSQYSSNLLAAFGVIAFGWLWVFATTFTGLMVFSATFIEGHAIGDFVNKYRHSATFGAAVAIFSACFLLIVAAYAMFYTIVDSSLPLYHFRSGHHGSTRFPFATFLYFSLMTITTVGYGDIVPLSTFCRLLCCIEVVQGILLLAITLSFVIGVYNGRTSESQP